MQRLDGHIKISSEIAGHTKTKIHRRLGPTKPKDSIFKKAPKGLPIDLYDFNWFYNTLSISQRSHMADIDNFCFLPEVELSLLGKAHPDEHLKDKAFTKKNWDSCAQGYNLDFLTAGGGTDDEDEDEIINVDVTDDEEDDNKEDFEEDEDETEFEDKEEGV
ncbi:uncharacterized protein MELLADRAFT_69839 [Melampsora larici-populina 98AG31]|uniref:Uncharacterized protein n=1 Tax=Melampsora larici-populina (strain 98AG31 / pathotype 3-4-7) TaxID=747676 RepID=F4SCE9_MELLP|nr:uncharacterized protein MELLADRAFT_69839 [Melampsora larici-populina 98AG31]EGF97688.1 hypothetical protein MELLADRAFT_69839 [Melampsora larici-populina 98AG31]